jgi:hypothetical protein
VKAPIFPVPDKGRPIDALLFAQGIVVPSELVKNTGAVVVSLHRDWLGIAATSGVGFTAIIKFCEAPAHPLAVGVTVKLAVSKASVVFIPAKGGILPLPVDGRPIEVLLFVQAKVEPLTVLVKLIAGVLAPLHTSWLATGATNGIGLTVITKLCGAPVHPLADGRTVTVPAIGAVPILLPVKEGIFPVPATSSPIAVLVLDQEKEVPLTVPVKFTADELAPLHIDWSGTALTTGVGLMAIVKLCEVPTQLSAVGVTVIVDVSIAEELFTATKEGIEPVPLAASPFAGLLLDQE